ncbi:MAG: chemotaxis protein CheW [Haloarculaceae archaeon]
MSDNERMERAKRIRQMREGQRVDEEEEPDDGNDGQDGPTPTEVVENVAGMAASVPDIDEIESAMEQTMEQAETVESEGETADSPDEEAAAAPAGIAEKSTSHEADTRVLEFTLADEQYCLDIEYIEEIVKEETLTRVPNTPDFVEGVVDLRGQITTLLNPKVAIGKDDQSAGGLIIVFDSEAFDDQGHIGWVVDDVRQVSPVTDDQVNDPPMGEDYINGVIDRDDDEEFVIWTTPDLALEEAE